jgi:hypothetical protein
MTDRNYPQEFETQFWPIYPRKQDKVKARKAWLSKASQGLIPAIESVLKAIRAGCASDQWQRGFVPLATTYINGERWADEYEIDTSAAQAETNKARDDAKWAPWLAQGKAYGITRREHEDLALFQSRLGEAKYWAERNKNSNIRQIRSG